MTMAVLSETSPLRSANKFMALLRFRDDSRPSYRRLTLSLIAPVALIGILAAGWEWVAINQTSVLPTIGSVAADFGARPEFYWSHLEFTVANALVGFVIGVGVAWLLGLIVVHLPVLRSAIMPVATAVHATPIVAVAPALVVAFGFGRTPHLITVALIVFFPMLINTIAGLRAVPTEIMEVLQSMSASTWDTFLHVRLPASLPFLFAAGKTCVTLAMIGAVVSEFHGGNTGLGASIVQAMTYLDLAQMWVCIALSALTSLLLLGLVGMLEKAVVRW